MTARLNDEQRADILLSHHLNRLKDRHFGSNAPNCRAFLIEDFLNSADRIHGWTFAWKRTRHGEGERPESIVPQILSLRMVIAADIPAQA